MSRAISARSGLGGLIASAALALSLSAPAAAQQDTTFDPTAFQNRVPPSLEPSIDPSRARDPESGTTDGLARRQQRGDAAEIIQPLGRLDTRISNRVNARIDNRIDRDTAPNDDLTRSAPAPEMGVANPLGPQ